jgi:hypothetical protein
MCVLDDVLNRVSIQDMIENKMTIDKHTAVWMLSLKVKQSQVTLTPCYTATQPHQTLTITLTLTTTVKVTVTVTTTVKVTATATATPLSVSLSPSLPLSPPLTGHVVAVVERPVLLVQDRLPLVGLAHREPQTPLLVPVHVLRHKVVNALQLVYTLVIIPTGGGGKNIHIYVSDDHIKISLSLLTII